ncbi:hypothetical protein ACUFKR_003687 [Vibrio cholerae]|uniref:hypothetical protein n=1 Tax=Vibrio cholerae TaxID=666 RepID=UPI00285724CB|nr:hypothetical protein [Vibrio cholerae]EJL6898298.1 hypothetical protein [Vibrio cholerae]EKF6145228.1 hypothetical protein [Vibrio cholerae]EKF9619901.1 hypothetical protein [Vibrio cholerae]ELE0371205.1 hypothetical protein [Vibrio cholerae]ELL0942652.1 hypothetical protein [Vibrio cholerae]
MDKKVVGLILGIVGVFLWFMPFVKVEMFGFIGYQNGTHIGGIAYLLIAASLAYSILSWFELHVPRIVAAIVSSAICSLFLVQAGSSTQWGLIALAAVSLISVYLSVKDHSLIKKTPVSQ